MYWLLFCANTATLVCCSSISVATHRCYSIFPLTLLALQIFSLSDHATLEGAYSAETLIYGQSLMLIGNLALMIWLLILDTWTLPHEAVPRVVNAEFSLHLSVLAVAILALTVAIRFRHGIEGFGLNWEARRVESGVLDAAASLTSMIFFPLVWVLVLKKRWLIVAFLLPLAAFLVILMGSRAAMLGGVMAMALSLIIARRSLAHKATLLALIAVIALALHTSSRLVRVLGLEGVWDLATSGAVTDLAPLGLQEIDFTGGESEIYRAYYYVIERSETGPPYRQATTLVRLVLMYIPTYMTTFKPPDITYQIWTDALSDGLVIKQNILHLMEQASLGAPGSLHPTFWGDAYATLGWFGILLYPFLFAVAFVMLERLLAATSSEFFFIAGGIAGAAYAMMARGNIVIGAGYIAYVWIAAAVLFLLLGVRIARKATPAPDGERVRAIERQA